MASSGNMGVIVNYTSTQDMMASSPALEYLNEVTLLRAMESEFLMMVGITPQQWEHVNGKLAQWSERYAA